MGRFLRKLATPSRGQNSGKREAIALKASLCLWAPICFFWGGFPSAGLAQAPGSNPEPPSLAQASCPPQDLSVLVTQLMLDLPSYSNRVTQRASDLGDPTPLYFLAAGQAEISPLSLGAIAQDPHRSRLPVAEARRNAPDEEIYTILFTTLERQYVQSPVSASASVEQTLNQAAPSFQQFHRLILARQVGKTTATGPAPWRILSLRSQLVPYPSGEQLLAPARDSRTGSVGQGVVLWLRDWHSGAIKLSPVHPHSSSANEPDPHPGCIPQ